MSTKTCNTCGETKPLDAFHANNRGISGRHGSCRQCRSHKDSGRRDDRAERRTNRAFSLRMAAIPAFNRGPLSWVV